MLDKEEVRSSLILEARKAMELLIAYDGNFKNTEPEGVRERILWFADYIKGEIKAAEANGIKK